MSTSLPSREAIVIDVPEVRNFEVKFQYNFFVTNEGTDENGGVPLKVRMRRSDTFDTSFIETLTPRVPRFVRFSFSPVVIQPKNKNVDDNSIRNNRLGRDDLPPDYIRNNYSKILDEDFFSSENFTAVNLSDQSIDKKLFNIISGTAVWMASDKAGVEKQSHKQLARDVSALTSDDVDYQFLSKFLVQPSENGIYFFEKDAQRIRNEVVNRLKDVNIHMQINNKFINNLLDNAVSNPQSTHSDDYITMFNTSKAIQQQAVARSSADMARDDYKVIAEYTSVSKLDSATSIVSSDARIVGYVIDKYEILQNGTIRTLDPIIIENPFVASTIDTRVKYYSTYVYSIRTVAEFTIPAIIDDTGELVVAKVLVTSKPSTKWSIPCVEIVPPPSPTDFNFHWNYETSQLGLLWTFPPNVQRDVKKFQVFRRASINEPFQLLKMYDFDDSEVKAEQNETIFPGLIEVQSNPTLFYVDPDFTKDSKFIYAVVSIDAHGMSSNYSDQFEITFDKFKNKLIKKRISASGAPKPYPNMYLSADTFVDSILDENHRQVEVIFDPDHLSIFDSQRRDLQLLARSNDNASYRLQFINLDLQKERVLKISVDDMRTPSTSQVEAKKV